jgi:lycopene beta-cyclase
VGPEALAWLEPLVEHRWPSYDVVFPQRRRRLEIGYSSLTSPRLDVVVRGALASAPGSELVLGEPAVDVQSDRVVLGDGRVIEGTLVVDARGMGSGLESSHCDDSRPDPSGRGYQKFLGLEVRLREATTVMRPVIMDATVAQLDGFRFVYTLPLAPDRLLIEDTYYSDSPSLDRDSVRARVRAYADDKRLQVDEVLREETGVLPVPWTAESKAPQGGPLRAGYGGGFFHPTTGYSLPVAVRLASCLASVPPERAKAAGEALRARHARQSRFCRLLNWLLFRAYPPDQRFHVLDRFYRLPEATIRRFYALELTMTDRARLLLGRPPAGLSLRAAFSRWQAA